jgi:hypothetical protein
MGMALPVPGLHGAHLRSDLVRLLGPRQLANAIANKEVRPLWRGVVVESGRFLDPWTRSSAALLSAGEQAVVTGVTAAHLHGCRSVDSSATHILLPYGPKIRSRLGLVVHNGRFVADDVTELDGIRVFPLDRVVADILCTSKPQDALAAADEALRLAGGEHEVFRKKVAERLRRRADPRGTVRGAGLLDLASERVDSPPESWVRLMLIERGFPVPEVNWPIHAPDGTELYRLDLAWPALRIVVEYDGYEFHVGREADDGARADDLRRRGWIVIRADSDDLRDLSRVTAELRAAFARRGYIW